MRSSKGDLHLLTVGAYLGCNPSRRQVYANLETALCPLRKVRNLKEIRIVDSSEARKTPPGYAVLERSAGQALVGPEDEIRPVQLVADVLAMSLTQLESFVVKFGNWNLPFFALSKVPRIEETFCPHSPALRSCISTWTLETRIFTPDILICNKSTISAGF